MVLSTGTDFIHTYKIYRSISIEFYPKAQGYSLKMIFGCQKKFASEILTEIPFVSIYKIISC